MCDFFLRFFFFFFKQKTAYEIGTGDWSSDVCSSDLSFASKGKKTHYKLIKSDAQCQQAMKALGESFEPTDHLYSLCEAYTCKLYGQEDGDDINKLRYKLFITKSGASQSLPPCRESLRQHINRANFVAAVWKQADTGTISPPPPTCHGWILNSDDEDYSIRWHDGDRKSTRLNSSHPSRSRMPSSA